MMLYTKVTMHTVGHFPINNSDRPIAMPATSIMTPQNTPSFHAKLTFFLSPHAQNSPKMPNNISSQNGLTIKKCIPTLLLSSKLSQVKDEPGYSIEISNVISGKAKKKTEMKIIIIDIVAIISQIYFASPFSLALAFTWESFLILDTPWFLFDELLIEVDFCVGCKLSLVVTVFSPFCLYWDWWNLTITI